MSNTIKDDEFSLERELSDTDICVLIRYYLSDFPIDSDERFLFNYIDSNFICTHLSISKEEAVENEKYFKNNPYASYPNKLTMAERLELNRSNILDDEEVYSSIRDIILLLSDKAWTKISTRVKDSEYLKYLNRKGISLSDEVFYQLHDIKTKYFLQDPWDVVLSKLITNFNEENNATNDS